MVSCVLLGRGGAADLCITDSSAERAVPRGQDQREEGADRQPGLSRHL